MANHRGGSGNFAEDRERASEAGKRWTAQRGNFKNDPQRASEAGKRWQEQSRQKRQLAGLINDECIFFLSSSKVITAGNPGGFLLWLLMNNFWRWNVNQPSA